jgi:hypothetical protein
VAKAMAREEAAAVDATVKANYVKSEGFDNAISVDEGTKLVCIYLIPCTFAKNRALSY